MEIKNDLVMCVKNHYFNAALHQACPICGSPAVGGRPGGFVPTVNPGMGAAPAGMGTPPAGRVGSFSPTEAPQAAAAPSAPPRPTAPANSWNAPGGAVNPFSSPTVIGGDVSGERKVDPVVGWLVCIEGPLRGTAWNLHAGYNYIGRETGDIHIQGDDQISREKHATVAYYGKNHTYYVGPAEGRNIIELNGEPVFSSTQLGSRDIIKMGTTKLLFVPLCGEDFNWDQEKTNA